MNPWPVRAVEMVAQGGVASDAEVSPNPPRGLFHPAIDMLVAGGVSVIAGLLVFLVVGDEFAAGAVGLTLSVVLSDLINFPHFAHSYQLLYRGFIERLRNGSRIVKIRYWWAGVAAPAALVAYLFGAYLTENPASLGMAANLMLFLVGWHYMKQGFGVLVVLSARKAIFYSKAERRLFLFNGHAVWISAWMALNDTFSEKAMLGIQYTTWQVPGFLVVATSWLAVATTVGLVAALFRRWAAARPISFTGLLGYGSALYLWVVARYLDPVYALLVPSFHSLQYLLFVWRYEITKARVESARFDASFRTRRMVTRFAGFIAIGIILGWLGFTGLPILLQGVVAPDTSIYGPSVFVFMFAVGINIHHYLIDNVIWRRENEDARRYLFAR